MENNDFSRQIRQWIDKACVANEIPKLTHSIDFEWNDRFLGRLGDATYFQAKKRGRIRLSLPLWPLIPFEEQYDTIIHEACHVIARYKYGYNIQPHGKEWQAAMWNSGLEPRRLAKCIDKRPVKKKKKPSGPTYFFMECPKANKCTLTQENFKKLQRGKTLYCSKCSLGMSFHDIDLLEDEELC